MKLCSITPLHNASLMFEEDMVMLLAHLAELDESYSAAAAASSKYKIMDNSIIEVGSSFSMGNLVLQASKCKADEIILPDEFEDGAGTIKKVISSIKWLKRKKLLGKYKLMAVCHGKNLREFQACFKLLDLITEVDVIGIPKATQKWCINRSALADTFLGSSKEIHFLGCYDSLREVSVLKENKKAFAKVRSIDTCVPSILAAGGEEWWESRKGRTIDLQKFKLEEKEVKQYKKIMQKLKKELFEDGD